MQAWQATVQDDRGNALPNPVVTVYLADGETLATVYTETGAVLTNPITGSIDGFMQFYAMPGRYKVQAAGGDEWDVSLGGIGDTLSFADRATAESANVPSEVSIIQVAELSYKRAPGGTALVTADGGTWVPNGVPLPDHWKENSVPGVTDMQDAIQAAANFGDTTFRATDYAVGARVEINRVGALVTLPNGARVVGLPSTDRGYLFGLRENVTLRGDGEIDCRGYARGVVALANGITVENISIKNPLGRAVNVSNRFGPNHWVTLRGIKVYHTSDVVEGMAKSDVLPLTINVDRFEDGDITQVIIEDCRVDFSAWTPRQISEIGYPNASFTPNIIGIRVGNPQEGGKITRCYVRRNTIILPEVPDRIMWNPSHYPGNAPDSIGMRRPTCMEIKSRINNPPSNLDDLVCEGNIALGGDIGLSFGRMTRMLYNNNQALGQTRFCGEFTKCTSVSGSGNIFGGWNASQPLAVTNLEFCSLPGSTIHGPKNHGFDEVVSAFANEGARVIHLPDSQFFAVHPDTDMILLTGGGGDHSDNQIVNLQGSQFHGMGLPGVRAIVTRGGTTEHVNLMGCQFNNITGNAIRVVTGAPITTLNTVGVMGVNSGGFVKGSVTNHLTGYTSGVANLNQQRGTWLPLLTNAAGGAPTYVSQNGSWARDDSGLVTVTGRITISSRGSLTGNLRIAGIPFPIAVGTFGGGIATFCDNLSLPQAGAITLRANQQDEHMTLFAARLSTGYMNLDATHIGDNFTMIFSASYMA